MSPSLPAARQGWFWSLPAFAILLSFLWYRKKRGSLKTVSGGAVEETRNDRTSGNCEEEEEEEDDEEKAEESAESRDKKTTLMISDELKVSEDINRVEVIEVVNQKSESEIESSPSRLETAEKVAVELFAAEREAKVEESTAAKKGKKSRCRNKLKKMAKKTTESASQKKDVGKNAACILEQKLAELDLSAKKCNNINNNNKNNNNNINSSSNNNDGVGQKPINEDVAERDSANNSPSEVMLASPSVSGYSDTHSEGSSDSGKGCSEMLTPSRTPASGNSVSGDAPAMLVYEFEIPQRLVGRLIGRHGNNAYEIKRATNATIYIKKHPHTDQLKICAIEGTQMDVDSALEMIRRKFAKKRFPTLTLEQVVISPEPLMVPIFPENYQLYLIEGINNDVILSSLVSAGHFFLQQPTHPTFPALARLNSCMALCYSQPNQPSIPEGVGAGVLCAAPVHDGWYRAQITEMEEGNELCSVKFVDYGGYMTLPVSSLRQIRADFINLPFQASECYLADVKPANGEIMWSEEAKEAVEKLTFGNILQAQVYGYAFPGVPLIYLYTVVNSEFILVNEELVNRGYAEWQYPEYPEEVHQQEEEELAVVDEVGAEVVADVKEEAEPVAVPI